MFVRFHSHKHTRSRKEQGFFLFLFSPLLHPPTAAAGHLDPSSSFASQPEHSGPAEGGKATRHRGPSLFHEAGGHLCRTITVKIRTRPTRILFFSFLPCFFFARFSLTHTPTTAHGVLKRKSSVAHTHTRAHTCSKIFVEENSTFSRFSKVGKSFLAENTSHFFFSCRGQLSPQTVNRRKFPDG